MKCKTMFQRLFSTPPLQDRSHVHNEHRQVRLLRAVNAQLPSLTGTLFFCKIRFLIDARRLGPLCAAPFGQWQCQVSRKYVRKQGAGQPPNHHCATVVDRLTVASSQMQPCHCSPPLQSATGTHHSSPPVRPTTTYDEYWIYEHSRMCLEQTYDNSESGAGGCGGEGRCGVWGVGCGACSCAGL